MSETTDITVPAAGESITEADIAVWYKSDGDTVAIDEPLLELETDKASMDVNAPAAGVLTIAVSEGTVSVGQIIGTIAAEKSEASKKSEKSEKSEASKKSEASEEPDTTEKSEKSEKIASPAAAKGMREHKIDPNTITGTGKAGRITKGDVLKSTATSVSNRVEPDKPEKSVKPVKHDSITRPVRQERVSRLRRTIASRLVNAQQTAALLSTFNDVDMHAVMALRSAYKADFKEKYGVNLGFMSFFTKAVCSALQAFPIVNAQLTDEAIVYHDYCDIGVAVSTPRGLVVPVVRNAESLAFHEIESAIIDYATQARDGTLTPDDMTGGTFTITNGGVFGSLLSTPIVNQPQSAILGMHTIAKRPVALDDAVVIRPMMYIALTYDHRLIDGRDAVQFLVHIKQLIEAPERLLLGV